MGFLARVNNFLFDGWKAATIEQSLDSFLHSFSIEFSDKWSETKQRLPFSPGDEIELFYNSTLISTGYIDSLSGSFSAEEKTNNLTGRSITSLAVDSSIEIPKQFRNISLFGLAQELLAPLGLLVFPGADTGEKILIVASQPGESPFEILERLARERGLLIQTTPEGQLQFITNKKISSGTDIVEGINLKSLSWEYNFSERFSKYIVLGSQGGKILDGFSADQRNQVKAESIDPKIILEKPLVILSESQGGQQDLQKRADWENSVRYSRSQRFEVSLQGWTKKDGGLWKINELTRLYCPTAGIDLELLISKVSFSVSLSEGYITNLSLVDKGAYLQSPENKDLIKKSGDNLNW